jgi:hypothetical protein
VPKATPNADSVQRTFEISAEKYAKVMAARGWIAVEACLQDIPGDEFFVVRYELLPVQS